MLPLRYALLACGVVRAVVADSPPALASEVRVPYLALVSATPSRSGRVAWIIAGALAFVFSSVHLVLDWHIGLFGDRSDEVSLLQATLAWLVAALGGLWITATAAAARDIRWGFAVLVPLYVVWVIGGNGVPIFACPPPCRGAFPHQDIAHLGSLIFGGLAAVTAWRSGREIGMSGRSVATASVGVIALLAIIFWTQVQLL